MDQHFPELKNTRTASRGISKFSKIPGIFVPNLIFLSEFSVGWFALRKFKNGSLCGNSLIIFGVLGDLEETWKFPYYLSPFLNFRNLKALANEDTLLPTQMFPVVDWKTPLVHQIPNLWKCKKESLYIFLLNSKNKPKRQVDLG